MPKAIDKAKWERVTYYLDIVMLVVFIGCLYFMVRGAVLIGFFSYQAQAEGGGWSDYNASLWGFIAATLVAAFILFWIYYRYFKTKLEKKGW